MFAVQLLFDYGFLFHLEPEEAIRKYNTSHPLISGSEGGVLFTASGSQATGKFFFSFFFPFPLL